MSKPSARRARSASPAPPRFTPARPRPRHDGWTPERQVGFIDALAASGCVAEACAAVGMSKTAAYNLRVRPEAQQFRMAWDAALDLAIRRLADDCFSRALAGVPVPHFYKGEQVGEHRRYDTRLAMFLLRYRDPLRYARTLDEMVFTGHPEGAGIRFAHARNAVLDEATRFPDGEQLPAEPPYEVEVPEIVQARHAEQAREAAIAATAKVKASLDAKLAAVAARLGGYPDAANPGKSVSGGDAAATSSTSGRPPPCPTDHPAGAQPAPTQ